MSEQTSNGRWQEIKDVLVPAMEIEPAARRAYLDAVCGDDADIRSEVESLLASLAESGDFIETPVFSTGGMLESRSPTEGRHFGNFEIIREIAAGGMGAVYLAKRTNAEFEQLVALKIVRQSIADTEVIERFRKERRILASLNHPHIARLIDGGVSDAGEPYIAMEFVEGETITDFVCRVKPSLGDTLRLFVKVCRAVAFAHRNLIVHRDIKPGNILVTKDGEPRLLDFGLARLVDDNVGSENITKSAFRALTPAYASPEQIRGEMVTTGTDIYSLGVVLYEILTGARPFHFEGKTLDQILLTLKQEEPLAPSTTAKANSALRGDVDNIILTALRLEPERRYRSAEDFAVDIERYLSGRPVAARPNTVIYRTGKFFVRHKIAATAAALILVSVFAGIGATVLQSRATYREKVKADTVNSFLQTILSYSDTSSGMSQINDHDTTVKEVLNAAARRLETTDLASQPEVKAEIQKIIGLSYLSQGEYDHAERNLESALEMKQKIYGDAGAETLETLVALGQLRLARGDLAGAAAIFDQRIAILRIEENRGNIDPVYLLVALNDFALLQRAHGDSQAAETLLREALALRPKISPDNRIAVGIVESVYALLLSDRGDFKEAQSIVESRIADIRSQPNPKNAELAANLNAFGSFLTEEGNLAEGEKQLAEAESLYRQLFNDSYIPLGDNLRFQAQLFYLKGDYAAAGNKIDETLRIYKQNAKPQFINYPAALVTQGLILVKTNRPTEAEPILREALRLRLESLPREHFLTAIALRALGECLSAQHRYSEAEPLLVESYEYLMKSQGPDNPRTLLAKAALDDIRLKQAQLRSD